MTHLDYFDSILSSNTVKKKHCKRSKIRLHLCVLTVSCVLKALEAVFPTWSIPRCLVKMTRPSPQSRHFQTFRTWAITKTWIGHWQLLFTNIRTPWVWRGTRSSLVQHEVFWFYFKNHTSPLYFHNNLTLLTTVNYDNSDRDKAGSKSKPTQKRVSLEMTETFYGINLVNLDIQYVGILFCLIICNPLWISKWL